MSVPQFRAGKGLLLIGALAAALSGIILWPAEAQNLNEAKDTLIFLGPYTLADLGDLAKDFERNDGPDEATTRKALAQCKFYLVDKRARKDGKWVFGSEEGYPKILMEGTLSHELKDKMGRDFLVHVKEFTVSADLTDNTVVPVTRRGGVSVTLIVKRGLGGRAYLTESRSSECGHLRYDSDGRTKGLVTNNEKKK